MSVVEASASGIDTAGRRKAIDFLSRAEIAEFTRRSDRHGAWAVLSTWALIAAALALAGWFPNPVTVALALVIVGGRQLALAILMHEASHGTLFQTKLLNGFCGQWLCGAPIWLDLDKYREHHAAHHSKTGSADDPDLSLVASFPTTRASLARKLLRDMVGLTGLKFLLGRFLMDAEVIAWTVAPDVRRLPRQAWYRHVGAFVRHVLPTLLVNLTLFGVLAVLGKGWLYGIWAAAYLTTFSLFIRIRSLAEHACTESSADPLRNTRTTRAGWLARMTVAPVRVNFHIEHHLLVTVPFFRLPALHRLLRERGALESAPGYLDVLRLVSASRAR